MSRTNTDGICHTPSRTRNPLIVNDKSNLYPQPLDHPPAQQVFLDDFIHIFPIDIGIPDPLGVNDDHRPLFTAIEATGGIDADTARTGNTECLAALFGIIPHGKGIKPLTASAAVFTQIGAEKHMVTIVGHASTIPENTAPVKKSCP
jgi:hypothetical protein